MSIYKSDASSNWYVQYNHPSEGQRKQSLRTKNKKEARRKAWETISKLRAGEHRPDGVARSETQGAMRGFLADKRRIGRRETTIKEYRQALEQFCQFESELGIARLDQLTPTHMEKFETQLRENGHCHEAGEEDPRSTGEKEQDRLGPRENQAREEHGQVGGGDAEAAGKSDLRIPVPADGEPENYCYTPAEVQGICQHAGPFFGDVFRFPGADRAPPGRIDVATKDDLDLAHRRYGLRAKVIPDERLRWDPKGDDRNVPLSAPALAIAQKMLAASKSRWLFEAPPAPGVVDKRLRAGRLWAQLKKAKKAAGVKRGTLHSFRHFFVSTMANANVSPFKVMKIVGHSSLDIILTYYHVSEEELLGAVDGVDFAAVLGETSKEEEERKVVNY